MKYEVATDQDFIKQDTLIFVPATLKLWTGINKHGKSQKTFTSHEEANQWLWSNGFSFSHTFQVEGNDLTELWHKN